MTTDEVDILERIAARRRERLNEDGGPERAGGGRPGEPAGEAGAEAVDVLGPTANSFLAALAARRGRAVIAEVKMGSPRLGSLAGRLDPQAQARAYREGGAAALSVVVEPDFFGGSYELLTACARASGLPAIAKDFVVSERQLEWAAAAGASAVLLIASLMESAELAGYADRARRLGLAPLVEVHSAADLEKLAGASWELVGVNNRDLRTFEVSLERSIETLPRLPAAALKVAESGLRAPADVARLARAGFDAFLVGESLLEAEDPAGAVRNLRSWT